ncbi:hypothetical protein BDZ89DRAFT_1133297 [Hymenopellis radicata]|nr:hypothetical protein BDZ89DRAFT_1133297 [Hymenopellis radicata]
MLSDQSGLILIAISSLSTEHDTNPIQYQIHLFFSGLASCSCPDFANHGGACKHIRAALMYIENLRGQFSIPPIPIPSTEQGARLLYSHLTLTGNQISASLSTPAAGKADLSVPAITRAAERLEDIINERADLHEMPSLLMTNRAKIHQQAGRKWMMRLVVPVMRSHIGIQEQGRARYLHTIRANMPKLEEFAGFLSEITLSYEDHAETDKFLDVLRRLSQGIEQKRLGASARHVKDSSFAPPSTPPPRDGKRKRSANEVMSPSPEKKQKRHESYSIH